MDGEAQLGALKRRVKLVSVLATRFATATSVVVTARHAAASPAAGDVAVSPLLTQLTSYQRPASPSHSPFHIPAQSSPSQSLGSLGPQLAYGSSPPDAHVQPPAGSVPDIW